MKVVGLIADIVESREIPARAEFQRNLKFVLDAINGRSAERLLSPFTITIGDEFQALYVDFQTVFRDIFWIAWQVHPHRIRFAINYNLITTELNRDSAVGMDGPVFHGAREQLDVLKQRASTAIRVGGLALRSHALINAALDILCDNVDRWPRTAVGVLAHDLSGLKAQKMAEPLGVTLRGVYKSMNDNNTQHHGALLRAITDELESGMES
ncbi:MAG: hypothetical protein EA403_15035 [Spirochaetaceae bacterium]|nr:MAG: hypothetical protein EA403_15035 [Spirochaetaceae bacterium]